MKTKTTTAPITIDKNIPIPAPGTNGKPAKNGKASRFPFRSMKLGHSFFVPGTTSTKFSPNSSQFKKLNKGFNFTVRKWTKKKVNGIRCWRIKVVKKAVK